MTKATLKNPAIILVTKMTQKLSIRENIPTEIALMTDALTMICLAFIFAKRNGHTRVAATYPAYEAVTNSPTCEAEV